MITRKELSKIFKKARELKGLSQRGLAKELDMHSQQYNKYESGDSFPELDNFEKIAKFLEIPYTVIFGDKEKEDVFSKSDKRLIKYAKLHDALEKDNELAEFLLYYAKHKEKFKTIKYTRLLKELSNFTPDKQKEILAHLRSTMKIAKGKK